MKLRLGFVSNSSSETFTCALCGETEWMWDWDVYDFKRGKFVFCEHKHIICRDHLRVPIEKIAKAMGREGNEDCDLDNIPAWCCPLCCVLGNTNNNIYENGICKLSELECESGRCVECGYFKAYLAGQA